MGWSWVQWKYPNLRHASSGARAPDRGKHSRGAFKRFFSLGMICFCSPATWTKVTMSQTLISGTCKKSLGMSSMGRWVLVELSGNGLSTVPFWVSREDWAREPPWTMSFHKKSWIHKFQRCPAEEHEITMCSVKIHIYIAYIYVYIYIYIYIYMNRYIYIYRYVDWWMG